MLTGAPLESSVWSWRADFFSKRSPSSTDQRRQKSLRLAKKLFEDEILRYTCLNEKIKDDRRE